MKFVFNAQEIINLVRVHRDFSPDMDLNDHIPVFIIAGEDIDSCEVELEFREKTS